jgi:hypothetical protein
LCCGGEEKAEAPPIEEKQEPEATPVEQEHEIYQPPADNPASAWHFAIEAVNVDQGHLGWKGIHLQDTIESLETILGYKLPLLDLGAPSCGGHWADITYEGMTLQLQFEGPDPDAELESLFIPISPYGGDKDELVNRLKSEIPNLVYSPSIHEPDLAESENPIPTYELPDDYYHAVLLKPEEGLIISITLCLN